MNKLVLELEELFYLKKSVAWKLTNRWLIFRTQPLGKMIRFGMSTIFRTFFSVFIYSLERWMSRRYQNTIILLTSRFCTELVLTTPPRPCYSSHDCVLLYPPGFSPKSVRVDPHYRPEIPTDLPKRFPVFPYIPCRPQLPLPMPQFLSQRTSSYLLPFRCNARPINSETWKAPFNRSNQPPARVLISFVCRYV